MSIIKCPECRGKVSTMAGTCPHCGTNISGHLRTCPECGSYCLGSQEKCPECGCLLAQAQTVSQPAPPASAKERTEGNIPQKEKEAREGEHSRRRKRRSAGRRTLVGVVILLILLCTGYYFHDKQRLQQQEQADYERLLTVTNPDFCREFLSSYPDSKHFDEINERMLMLQAEAEEWEQLQRHISRAAVLKFMQDHPESLRLRICEDMLDSIDWQKAEAANGEEALTEYLSQHPSGRHAAEAAERKNALLLAKVTPGERAMLRGTLEAFFSNAIARQDTAAAREAIPDSMFSFCGRRDADAEAVMQYASRKMEKDVIGLHYLIGQQMKVHKESLPDGNTGFEVEVSLQETISRSDTNQPTSNLYRVSALINQEQKIVRMNITQ